MAYNEEYVRTLVSKIKKDNKDSEEAFNELVTVMKPSITNRVNYYAAKSNLPKDVLEIDAIANLQNAVKNFDIKSNNKFKTFAEHHINKIIRTGYEYANIGYIPEHRIRKINTYNTALDNLKRRLKRMPSSFELADELGWPVKEIDRMQSELRREIVFDSETTSLVNNKSQTEKNDMLDYIRYELTPEERVVYERLTGLVNNNTPMSPQDIAKDIDQPISYVYNMKTKLKRKINKILQGY